MRWWLASLSVLTLGCGRIGFEPALQVTGRYRKPITIDHTKVHGGPHAGFPVLIHLAADADLAAHARPDGFDILFAAADGTELPYEREAFDPATGQLDAWVRVPLLTSDADTTLYLIYGDPAAADSAQPSAVWDPAFEGVWHFAGTMRDSTAHHNDATTVNGLGLGPGQIGTGLAFDGADDYLDVPASESLTSTAAAGTFSVWIDWAMPVRGNYQMVMSSSNRFVTPRDGFEWANQPGGDHYFYPWGGIESDFNLGPNPFTAGTWQYLAVTLEYATHTVIIYVDGVPMTTTQDVRTLWTQLARPQEWLWGGNPAMGSSDWFLGTMDEIHVASAVRSSDWLTTELANQRTPATFYTVGAELGPAS